MKKIISGWSLIKIFTLLVYIWMFAPIVAVVILAFNPQQFGSFPMEGFSFKWFVKLSQNSTILDAFKNSLVLGSFTAIFATAIGVPAAMAFIRYEFRGKDFINTLLLAPIMIPEVILGVALLLFIRWLQQPKSFALVLIGHVVLTLPYVLLIVQARLVGIKKEYEEAALSLGASPFQTFREITFPLLAPAIFAGMLFAFTISFDDVTATLFWATAQNQTVPVKIFGMLRNSISPEINALGAVMIVLTVSTPLLAGYISRKFAKGPGK
ncbi:ABC transporter permease [Desulfobacula sp.]|jgi:spermidine/putrescine transport system permease protein|uniref:ABC transporter permease n=4 Tax=Desulfobacula sp. TaxID=2593537 RepID=UPI001DE0DE51|nr:ABC transporter permease [Desulfobacula sp.]MBT4027109.1 ABC transporter permease [Desulfobacula sp.]MBT4200524.1 ABC transporter permease [Desulfobacula sp.]MBT4509143.1 ABC transporter permease [Desulfobacula sp.]